MLKTLFKWAIVAALLFAGFKGAQVWATFRFADHLNSCTSREQLCRLVKQQAPAAQIGATMRETFACVRQKQSWVETKLFPVNKELSDPAPGTMDYSAAVGLCS